MMDVFENIKSYFYKMEHHQMTGSAPMGVCPNCWGRQEWDGEYFKVIKGQNINPNDEIYDNFIRKVVRKLGKVTVKKNAYYCETCQVNFDKDN